jgi:triosephosphate isomerase
MNKLIVANWKENPKTEKEALSIFSATLKIKKKLNNIVICPPSIYLKTISDLINKKKIKDFVSLGAQNVFWEDAGPYTGEISPKMLKDIGAKYAIVGHSERRFWFNETDATIKRKIKACVSCGIIPILCVGEPLEIRQKGINAVKKFIGDQIKNSLNDSGKYLKKVIIAYEPIWAIGNENNAESKDIFDIAIFVKRELLNINKSSNYNPMFLYGGSVNHKNISNYLKYKEIDGALVGGASLNKNEWEKIINIKI